MEKIGTRVGRYEIVDFIGSGAMADVYRTHDPEINRSAALKLLKKDHLVDQEYLNRFLKEAKAAGALTHPNIVTVYDVGKIDDSPYIMMELLEGCTLTEFLQNNNKLSIKMMISISMQIASALDYAHNQGVVHRDIKPDNIIFHEQQGSVKIADFGIARFGDSEAKEKTQAGMILGTPRYMSPEQAKGETIDGRSDLFSLGVILYELLTGHKAFDAESIPTLIMQIIQKNPAPIRQYYPDAPAGLQSIIAKLLQKKPEKRFQSGAELHDALERELRVLQDDDDAKDYLPMQVKWTALMGGVVALIMVVSVVVVFRAQSRVLSDQVIDGGVALAKFIAAESAVPVLGEDWIGLETLIEEAEKRQTFAYMTVIDHDSIVRIATDKTLLEQPWNPPPNREIVATQNDMVIATVLTATGEDVFTFTTPILFNGVNIGKINVGISQNRLAEVKSVTKRIMTSLALTVILAVLVILYFFNKLVAKNLQVIQRTIQDFTAGNHNIRLSRPWKNEFGAVASAFNAMADAIHHNEDINALQTADDAVAAAPDRALPPQPQSSGTSTRKDPTTSSGDYTIIDTRINDQD